MSVSRQLLLERLEVVAPARADNDITPVLTHVCFTGQHVIACKDCDGILAISTPLKSEFKGCVPGGILTDTLKIAHNRAVVELRANGDNRVLIKLGNARVTLGMLPVEEFTDLFTMPDPPGENFIKGMASRFFAAVEHCAQSLPTQSTIPDKLGVTLIPDGNELQLFSTNSITLSRATLPLRQNTPKQRCILWSEFCQQMLRLAKQANATRLAVKVMKVPIKIDRHHTVIGTGGYALFSADDTLLFGRLIPSPDPLDFDAVIANNLPERYREQLVRIPRRLGPILKGAVAVAGIVGSEPYTEISIKDGVAEFHAHSRRGEFTETLRLPGHPDTKLRVLITNVRKAFKAFAPDRILFTERCVVLARGDLLHLTSAARER
jgi:hypothetical protein